MSTLFKTIFGAVGAIAIAASAHATNVVGNASATVAGALVVTENTPLSFGLFSANGSAGTIDTSGSPTGNITYFSGATPGLFGIVGAANAGVSTRGSEAAVTLSNGSDTMTAVLSVPPTVALDGTGAGTLEVTGVLSVAAAQPAGTYTGTYNLTFDYLQ